MRVVSGVAKGRLLKAPKGKRTRPMTEKVKEAIFDVLDSKVEGAYVLDLFAGSGSLGIEALSRGAQAAVFVDSSRSAVAAIKANLAGLHFQPKSEILWDECYRAIRGLAKVHRKFDIVFSDPPYQKKLSQGILEMLATSGIVAEGGIVITRCRKDEMLPEMVGEFTSISEKIYGDAKVTFWATTDSAH